ANLCGGRTRGGFARQVEIRAERRGRRRRHGACGCTERLERACGKERSGAAPGEEGRDAVLDCARLWHHRDGLEELEPFSGGSASGGRRRPHHPAIASEYRLAFHAHNSEQAAYLLIDTARVGTYESLSCGFFLCALHFQPLAP